jgi:plastocyanin
MSSDARAQTLDRDVVTPAPAASRRPPAIVVILAVPLVALIAILVTRAIEGPSSTGGIAAGTNTVVIKNFAFQPARLTVAPGTRLTITNRDSTAHTMSAKNGAFDTGPIEGGKSATVTVKKAGTYAYICRIHSTMKGTVVVR